jgi:hypothetical protein
MLLFACSKDSNPADTTTAPMLYSPANNAVCQSMSLELKWTTVADSSLYEIQVATDNNFFSIMLDDSTLVADSTIVSGLCKGTTYYWRVREKNGVAAGSWTNPFNFTTFIAAPDLGIPDNGGLYQPLTPTLYWNPANSASTYRVQVSTTAAFSSTVIDDSSVTGTSKNISATPPLLNNTTYYWRVSASASGQCTSDWSDIFSFTTGVAAPFIEYPMDYAILIPDTLTVLWYASPGATMYYMQLSTDSTFSTAFVVNDSTASTHYAITSPLSANEVTYFLRVRVSTSQGLSAWSGRHKFQTWLMPAPTLLTPADGASGVLLTDSLKWNKPVSNWNWVSSYHVQVSTVSDFSSNVVVDNTVSDTVSAALGSLSSGTYYWRVASIDILSRQSAWWSAVWSFTIP